jgi:uncharacterized membrane protein
MATYQLSNRNTHGQDQSVVHEGKQRMVELLRREFVVDAPRDVAWEWLSRVESWPSWAKHIKAARLSPDGP